MRKLVVAAVVLCAASLASAAPLQQPNGTPIPSQMGCNGGDPTGLAAVLACQCDQSGVCNIGAACPGNTDPADCDDGQNGTCETTIWHAWNDDACVPTQHSGLDPWNDGALTPETFQPTCPLTFTLLSRGTARFHDAFGWYNAGTTPPAASDLHVMLDCNEPPGTPVVLDVENDPAWQGGQIGFFLITPEDHAARGECAGGDCCARVDRLASGVGHVYYSQRAFNPDAAGPSSFIHLLVYDSQITERKFYFAWEDIYGGDNNDFTDLVTSVSGVECSGGGAECDTGQPGACAPGLTACRAGTLQCVPLGQSSPERCNGADDDCDGQIDEDATCPDGGVCDGGRCLPHCELGGEFQCPFGSECDTDSGRCVDPGCQGVTCDEGQTCVGGQCTTPCDGVSCPYGQSCRDGQCVDPCAHVMCDDGEVCREGICFPGCTSCAGIACGSGLTCVSGGECVDPSCGAGCPDGSHCESGTCVDDCDGAACPAGQMCVAGECCSPGDCPDPSGGGDAGPGGNGDGSSSGGCGCQGGGGGAAGGLLIAGLLIAVARRRRTA